MKILSLLAVCFIMLADVELTAANCSGGVSYYTDISTGSFTSPDYPADYPNSEHCLYEISTAGDRDIIFTVKYMDLQETVDCTSDYLLITNAFDTSEVWDKLCGNSTGRVIKGSSYAAYITFHTDSSVVGKGFDVSWIEVAAVTSSTTTQSPADKNAGIIAGAVIGVTVFICLVIALCCLCCSEESGCYYKNHCKKNPSTKKQQAKSYPSRAPHSFTQNPEVVMKRQESVTKHTETVAKNAEHFTQKPPPVDPNSYKRFDASIIAPAENKVAPAAKIQKRKRRTVVDKSKPVLPHIMISYQWDVKKEVLEFRDMLKEAGFRVWIDIEQMHKNTSTFDSMAKAVENSAIVIPVLTQQYQQSVNCRKEIEYADRCKVQLVPITMQSGYKPTSWLGFLLGSTQSYELAEPDMKESEEERLLSSLAELAESAMEPEDEEEDS